MPRIYTRKGDNGLTATLNRTKIKKSDAVIDLLGEIDELVSWLGLSCSGKNGKVVDILMRIQASLMSISAVIAGAKIKLDLVSEVKKIEEYIDFFESRNKPLKNFILPSGSPCSAKIFYARALCRRVERRTVKYKSALNTPTLSGLIIYLNRLSDLLFSMARYENKRLGKNEQIWKMGS